MNVLEIAGLTKRFGTKTVIDHMDLSIPPHSVFGFIGQNGAGKTTTMKMITGLLKPDGGTIRVCGEKVTFGSNKTNRWIGYLPDVPEFYGYMTAAQYLDLCGEITGMERENLREASGRLLELVGLADSRGCIRHFSRGMKQRLGIAQALLNSPRLLICDEPTSALDPVGRKEILDILASVKDQTTVLFSTHVLSDVERICDHAALLSGGRIAVQGTLEELKTRKIKESNRSARSEHSLRRPYEKIVAKETLQIEFQTEKDLQQFRVRYPSGEAVDRTTILLPGDAYDDMSSILSDLAQNHVPVRKLELLEPTLEDLFLEVTAQ